MSNLRVACQTYTWEMLGDRWQAAITDLLDSIAAAGYAGVEITNNMIGEFADRPADFARELQSRNLALAAFAYAPPSAWTDPARRAEDLANGRRWIAFVSHFAGARLALSGAAHPSREDLWRKLDHAIGLYNEVGAAAAAAGISANVHPHSHHGSLLESAEEYQHLLTRLDPRWVSLGPDTGHIVRGGQDLLSCLGTHLRRITHLHLKDVGADREWQPLGQGRCDFPAVLALLEQSGYDGWIVAEEESRQAWQDGEAAIIGNRQYLRSLGY